MKLRKATDRGRTQLDWLESWHSFSFADYYDPDHVQAGPLRVINDDVIAAGQGFGTHPHRDMEIITYVLDGAVAHKDSMGNGSTILPGEVQRMTAGTGVTHSEFNPSATERTRLLQIWIHPDRSGHTPGYEQIEIEPDDKRGKLKLIASRGGRDGSVSINQDADVYAALLDGSETASYDIGEGRLGWVQVARGSLEVNGQALNEGDGLSIESPAHLVFEHGDDAEFLLFDLPRHWRA
jgi:redox-sensitive bicupin YhaK (pirin superfamily)